ncbi:MAG TPA: hypothetical protein HPP80_04040 [Rhodospirillaceae bacterium]|nr:hypothetical protein [Rhodospirillaceae bacterium]
MDLDTWGACGLIPSLSVNLFGSLKQHMTNPEELSAHEILSQVRALLAAVVREADHRGAAEIVELAQKADSLVAQLREG